jgi:hypothetical protein
MALGAADGFGGAYLGIARIRLVHAIATHMGIRWGEGHQPRAAVTIVVRVGSVELSVSVYDIMSSLFTVAPRTFSNNVTLWIALLRARKTFQRTALDPHDLELATLRSTVEQVLDGPITIDADEVPVEAQDALLRTAGGASSDQGLLTILRGYGFTKVKLPLPPRTVA